MRRRRLYYLKALYNHTGNWYMPTSLPFNTKLEAKAALPMFEMGYGPARIIWHYAKQVQPTAPPAGEQKEA